jgi:protein phosphatase
MTELRSGSATDVGRVRSVNQDMALELPRLCAVADGMGGHAGGEVAARMAVESLETAFARVPTRDGLREAVQEANASVWHESQVHPDLHGMGTTLTALAVVDTDTGGDALALANVGDSRAYLYRRGELSQVTDDHSLAEERMRLGEITEEEAAVHPQRHILTRALGVSSTVDVDLWELGVPGGARVLLCSDGLTNEVGPDEMATILEREADPAVAARALVEAANEHGGADNITVVVVDVLAEDGAGSAEIATVPAVAATGMMEAVPAGPASGAPTRTVRPDDTLAPGSHLAFGSGTSTLLETGPRSDEFFVGSTPAPLSRTSTRVPPPPPPTARPPEQETRGERRRRLGVRRRVTFRVLGFLLLVAAVPVAAYYVLRWYAYDNWVVTLQGGQVVVAQGQPGGVLWFHPRVVDRTGCTVNEIAPTAVAPLKAGVQRSSLKTAKDYVVSVTTSGTPRCMSATTGNPTTSTTAPAP